MISNLVVIPGPAITVIVLALPKLQLPSRNISKIESDLRAQPQLV